MPRRGMQGLHQLLSGGNDSPFAWGNDFNESIESGPRNFEQAREAGILADMDARAQKGIEGDTQAYNLGFGGKYPQREMAEYGQQNKLAQLLLPVQARARLEQDQLTQEHAFKAKQGEMDRAASMERAQLTQGGLDARQKEKLAAAAAYAQKYKEPVGGPRFWEYLKSFGGDDEAVDPVSSVAPSPAALPGGSGGIRSIRQVR